MSSGFDPVPSDRLEVTSEVGAALTDFDYRVSASLLKLTHSLRWPKDTISYLVERMALDGLQIPVSQLSGFTSFTPLLASIAGQGSLTVVNTWSDLSDEAGPTLSALPDGRYVILWGVEFAGGASGANAQAGVKVNSTEAVLTEAVTQGTIDFVGVSKAIVKDLSNGDNNSLTLRYYQTTAGTTLGRRRWIMALKYANL